MPRYFDIQDHALTLDDEGMEFPNAGEAATHAIQAPPTIAAHETQDEQGLRDGLTVFVRDADGATGLLGDAVPARHMADTAHAAA